MLSRPFFPHPFAYAAELINRCNYFSRSEKAFTTTRTHQRQKSLWSSQHWFFSPRAIFPWGGRISQASKCLISLLSYLFVNWMVPSEYKYDERESALVYITMGAEARETCHFLFIVCICCRRRSNWRRGWLNHDRQVEFQWCRYWISNKGGIPERHPDVVTKLCRIAIALQSIHMTIVAKAASTHNSDRRRVIWSAWMEISAQNFSIPLIRALGISAQPRASGRAQMTVTRLYELMQITSGTNEWRSNWVCTQMDRWYPAPHQGRHFK